MERGTNGLGGYIHETMERSSIICNRSSAAYGTETEKSHSYDDITKLNIDGASGEVSTLGPYHLVIDAKSGKVQMAIYNVPNSKVDQRAVQAF